MRGLARESTVVQAQGQVSCELDGGIAILDVKSGTYFGLNPVGAFIWNLLSEPRGVGEILAALAHRYDAPAARLETDLAALLNELQRRELVCLVDQESATAPPR